MKKIAVLISGQGNNLQAIIDACQTQKILAEIVCVISNKANAFGLIRAQSAGIFSRVFLRNNFERAIWQWINLLLMSWINLMLI